jgi:Amt family ammonium transporter
MGLRVTAAEEIEGLDIGEHGNVAYPDFVIHPDVIGDVPTPKGPTGGVARKSFATESAQA